MTSMGRGTKKPDEAIGRLRDFDGDNGEGRQKKCENFAAVIYVRFPSKSSQWEDLLVCGEVTLTRVFNHNFLMKCRLREEKE